MSWSKRRVSLSKSVRAVLAARARLAAGAADYDLIGYKYSGQTDELLIVLGKKQGAGESLETLDEMTTSLEVWGEDLDLGDEPGKGPE
jgi:hypothetical protein